MMLYDDLTSEKRQIFQLLRLQHQFFTIVISTLRFNFLVSSEALLATGLVPPNPFPLILFLSIPCSVRYSATASTLSSDNFKFSFEFPWLSVCPES
jgi:hypothetical protein